MKNLLSVLFLSLAIFSMAACDGSDKDPFTVKPPESSEYPEEESSDDNKADAVAPSDNGRYLVLYASRTSNTEQVAQLIQETLNGDILEVEPEMSYDNDYNTMLERAQDELTAIRQGNYPTIKTSVEDFDDYDIIFVGYPIWYGSMASPMQTFLHTHASKLAQKRIALFATSGSSGISTSVKEAHNLCPDAIFMEESLLLTSSTLSQKEPLVLTWLGKIGVTRGKTEVSEETSLTDIP